MSRPTRLYTALTWASQKGRLDIVVMMLERNNVHTAVKNKAGLTALDVARNCGMMEVAQCLEEHTRAEMRRCEAARRGR